MPPQASFAPHRSTGRTLLQIALAGVALALAAVVILVAIDYLNVSRVRLAEVLSHRLALPIAPSAPRWNVQAPAGRQGPPSRAAQDGRPADR